MTCIVVNDEPFARNAIRTLINRTENLTLVASFNNTFEALMIMSKNQLDLVFKKGVDMARAYSTIISLY